jgi:hypothetical protein
MFIILLAILLSTVSLFTIYSENAFGIDNDIVFNPHTEKLYFNSLGSAI